MGLEYFLEVNGLTKVFSVPAVQDIHFKLKAGESLALVGANGAGKSTLIKMILGFVKPSQGQALLMGYPIEDSRAREKVGYLPEMPSFWSELSAVELLELTAKLRNLNPLQAKQRAEKILSVLGLAVRGARSMSGYSKGMLQRTGIAQALLHEPKFLILDEPMSGLDPRAQEKLRQILLSLKKDGVSLLISSHSLEDIRLLCDQVVVLEKSKLVLQGPTAEVLEELVKRYRSSEPWDEDPLGDWSEVQNA